MTGFGDGRTTAGSLHLHVEIRSVNNRYFKLNARFPEAYSMFESELETLIRKWITRGTINLSIQRVEQSTANIVTFDRNAVSHYVAQWKQLQTDVGGMPLLEAGDLLQLPGVIQTQLPRPDEDRGEWDLVRQATEQALEVACGT